MKTVLFFIFLSSFCYVFGQIPTNGLIRDYSLTGTAMDYSISDQDGTNSGASLTSDRFGRVKSAYIFDNSGSDYISFPNTNIDIDIYTYSIWANLSSLPVSGNRYFALTIGSSSGDQVISYDNNYQPGVTNYNGWTCHSYTNGTNVAVSTGSDASIDQWYNVVSVRSSSCLKLYVNGMLIDSVQDANTPYYGTGPIVFRIGSRFNGTLPFHGKIDDVKIYNRVLSAEEVTALYNEGIDYQYVKVSDTLEINLNISGFNPVEFVNTIKIFPNPTHEQITISTSNYEKISSYTLKIANSQGQELFSNLINQQTFTLNLSEFGGEGIYFVSVIDNKDKVIDTKKIVLK